MNWWSGTEFGNVAEKNFLIRSLSRNGGVLGVLGENFVQAGGFNNYLTNLSFEKVM